MGTGSFDGTSEGLVDGRDGKVGGTEQSSAWSGAKTSSCGEVGGSHLKQVPAGEAGSGAGNRSSNSQPLGWVLHVYIS